MRRILLIWAFASVSAAAMARMLPGDGQKQWRWVIDASMPGNPSGGELVDLSDAAISEAFESRYSVYGDTLVCRTMPGVRDWFVLRDGSLWTVGANDRVSRHAYSHGLMYVPEDLCPSVISASDTLTVSAIDTPPVTLTVRSTLSVSPGPGFILAAGDTVYRTVEVREQNVRTGATGGAVTVSDRRWYADGCMFPVVEETGIESGGELHATLTVCPPSEQPCVRGPKSRGDGYFGGPPRPEPGGEGCTGIVMEGGMIKAGGADLTISVCDIQGRVIRTGAGGVPTVGLPPGWYIITASGDTGDTSVKFRID